MPLKTCYVQRSKTVYKDGSTPYVGGQEVHVEVLRELLKHGANGNRAKKDDFTPLHIAGGNGHIEVLRELLNHGASGNIANNLLYSH